MEAHFKEFSSSIITFIKSKSTYKSFSDGQEIIKVGDFNSSVFFVLSGEAKAFNYNETGRAIRYAQFKPGMFFGELSAIDGLCRSATVVAKKNCTLAVLSEEDFNYLVCNDASFNQILIKKLVEIVRTGNDRIKDLTLIRANQRICIELLRLSVTEPGNKSAIIYDIPTQESFAENLGVSRETVIRTFRKLTKQGIIKRVAGKKVFIYQLKTLENLSLS
jgi:CRP/FNR family cyclic AMP-dependent transcriptional regulator